MEVCRSGEVGDGVVLLAIGSADVRLLARLRYRVVDEYNGDTLSGKTTRLCAEPMTLGELTDFFLKAWPLNEVLDMNELDEDESLDFVHASSAF